MSGAVEELLTISSPALVDGAGLEGAVPEALRPLLLARNGFYAFESALHVYADRQTTGETGLEAWNSPGLWRHVYEELTDGHYFFAEDVVGDQFSLFEGQIHTWSPETGAAEPLACDLEGWATAVLADYSFLTGQPLAHDWQVANGPLPLGQRLMPTLPFVLGGEFELENVRAVDAVSGMRIRGAVAAQIRGLPEGTRVRLHYT